MATTYELTNQEHSRLKKENLIPSMNFESDVEMKSERPESPVDITNTDHEATGVSFFVCILIWEERAELIAV